VGGVCRARVNWQDASTAALSAIVDKGAARSAGEIAEMNRDRHVTDRFLLMWTIICDTAPATAGGTKAAEVLLREMSAKEVALLHQRTA